MSRHVALLRGINVGGKNLIRMPALQACFQEQGFADVATYIQSGNVIFSTGASSAGLARRIEEALEAAFDYQATVMVRSHKQMQEIVRRAPAGFGADPARYRYDVIFLNPPFTAAVAMKTVPAKAGVDQAHPGPGVLYFSRLIARATQSRLGRIAALPIYKSVTIRNWNTTTALLRMLEAANLPAAPAPARTR
jgi:uncharacterized protein (DUF1697 family)